MGQLAILSDSQVEEFDLWNHTQRNYPSARVDQLFEQQAEQTPANPALTFKNESMTYSVLSRETGHLAARLRSLGVRPGVLVGICADRCHEMVIALLAILKPADRICRLIPLFRRIEFGSCRKTLDL